LKFKKVCDFISYFALVLALFGGLTYYVDQFTFSLTNISVLVIAIVYSFLIVCQK